VIGGANGRAVFELLVDIALPEVGGFQDVHVAVENFETILRHGVSSQLNPPLKRGTKGDLHFLGPENPPNPPFSKGGQMQNLQLDHVGTAQ
jgi:hypothetical protein